ncbi:hypothetical protein MY11210_007362 [Beauveria gryllotalpidicola]
MTLIGGGGATYSAMRFLVGASLVSEKNRATGAILAGPVMASAFRVGLQWGQPWYGLPFLAAGLLQLFTLLILIYVRQK